MKAVVMTQPGGTDVLQMQDVADPKLENNRDILVRLYAAGVNPIDTKLRKRGPLMNADKSPMILGCDGAGVVEAIASDVQNIRVGDEVYFCHGGVGGPHGNYAEYAVVDERFVAHKPKSLNFTEAAVAPLVLITAWESLYDRANLQAGQKALIHAGAGGVGHVAIQLAKLQGADVCTTVSTQEKADFVRQLGADLPIFYKQKDVVEAVMEWTNGEGVDVAFDTVGGETFFQTCPAVKIYGDLVTILEPNPEYGTLKTARLRNLRIGLELMLTPMLQNLIVEQQDQGKILQQCARLIDENKLKVQLSKTFPLADASAAHDLLETGSMLGKIALQIRE
ncbi:zinc-dependent alcohol dehydrogenase family protein [Phormidium sp. CCY1219]|uniref:zinc-dependent alcohol dehydrogenase family protein n=1 Tax=Phormidium sp. CCY1219 TaxID=2886104 RepID=UPI002D1EF909|nr:zinc-dependent alcohol dehydrogenase family protein [Phormidium sp. CCY1219]MEB3828742.1 zinc-dependent alcohol dehydrogenase family protein [Phormidium sp. CCY1219]